MSAPYKTVRIRQQSPEWLAFRRTHIGSSDAAVIAGESPYSSAIELYGEKVDGPGEIPEDKATLLRVGHRGEDHPEHCPGRTTPGRSGRRWSPWSPGELHTRPWRARKATEPSQVRRAK